MMKLQKKSMASICNGPGMFLRLEISKYTLLILVKITSKKHFIKITLTTHSRYCALSAHIGGLGHFKWLFRGAVAPIAPPDSATYADSVIRDVAI